jgi:EmrB/QacA subfamily drug resistance transporter
MVVLDSTIVNVALPAMRRGLHISQVDLQWVVNAYLLALGGLILLGGRLGDHYGRKRVYLIGAVIFAAASFAGGVAPSGAVLLAARGVQGVGAALLAPGTLSLLASAYTEPRARTRALAVWSATSASGGALGVFLGGLLTAFVGWRSVMFVNVPLGLLVVALGTAALPETLVRGSASRRLDVPGAVAVTAALTALVYAVVETESHSWGDTRTLAVLATSAVCFAAAVVIEARAPNPLIPFAVLRRGPVATTVATMLIFGAVMTAAVYFQSLYLQQVRGYSPLGAGLLLMPWALLVIATPPLASQVTSRYGPRAVAIVSLGVASGGLVWLSAWTARGSIVLELVAPTMVIGLGASICYFAISVLLTTDLESEHSGLGSGLFNAGRQVGGSVGLAVLAVLAAAHTRSLLHAHRGLDLQATASGYALALRVSAGLFVVAMVVVATHASRRRGRARAGERSREQLATPERGGAVGSLGCAE